jgi:hypothetical protein
MPIRSINDIDAMIANYKHSQRAAITPRSFSDPSPGYWVNNSYTSRSVSESSSPVSTEGSYNFMARVTRIFSPRDIVDEHGNFNSSKQLIK